MIISRGRKYIFVHAPKTGGTSLTLALEDRAMKDDILIGDTPKAVKRRSRLDGLQAKGRLWKHSTLADIEGVVNADELDDFFLVTIVRNPWDRAVSYYHWLQTQGFEHAHVDLAKSTDFESFVSHPMVLTSFERGPYGSFMTDATGREREAHFIRIEKLAEDIVPLEQHLGFSIGELPHVNSSKRREDYRGYYSDRTRALIAKSCAIDIERFDYRF